MISLKGTLKSGKAEGDKIVDAYFNHRTNPVRQLRTRVMFNYFIKLLYIIANLVAFFCTDRLLLGKFRSYGKYCDEGCYGNELVFDWFLFAK